MTPYIETYRGITLFIRGESKTISAEDPKFDKIRSLVYQGAAEGEILALLSKAERTIKSITRLSPRLTFVEGTLLCDDEPMHGYAVDKLLELINKGLPCQPLINFIDKLLENPSYRVVEQLYKFLEFGRIPLTQEGNFVAYKAVRADWMDIYSGRFDNSIGKTCSVPRNSVDEDPNRTCSHGLHVCSFDYLPHFAHANGHVVAVEVNPADVVAIPTDYNNTKMRVSEYKVLSEVTDWYTKNQNILAENPFFGEIEDIAEDCVIGVRVEVDWGKGYEIYSWEFNEEHAEDRVCDLLDLEGAEGARAFRTNETEPFYSRRA